MPKMFSYVLFEDDAATFYGNLQYDKENLWERQSELDPDNESDERERVSNIEVMRVTDILLGQHEQQKVTGPVVGLSLRQDQTEDLHLALIQQLAFGKRQAYAAAKLLTNPDLDAETRELLKAEWTSYFHQTIVVADLIKQVGRHL